MPRQKISDTERAERVREWARQSSARRRVKLMMDGKTQLLCWIPDSLRRQLDALATMAGVSLSETVEQVLQEGLTYRRASSAPDPTSSVDPEPFTTPVTRTSLTVEEQAARDQQILELKRQGLSGYAIAGQVGVSEPTVRRILKRLKEGEAV